MRLALHIFRKDARRLWWEMVVSLGLLAALAQMDSARFDAIPGPMEGLFNVLVPMVWSYLIALLIQQEPPVGDNQFWVTRPYFWPSLVGAKALFVALFIHVPLFISDAVILAVHHFQPLDYLPQLAARQLIFAGVFALPAAALAAVTKNVPQFVLSAAAIAVCGAFVTAPTTYFSRRWLAIDDARLAVVLLTTAAAGIAIVFLQISSRRTALARALAVGAVMAAGTLLVYLPREYTTAWQCTMSPADLNAGKVSIRLTPGRRPRPSDRPQSNLELVQIPVAIAGLEGADEILWEPLSFELGAAAGNRWRMPSSARRAGPVKDWVFPALATQGGDAGWLMLSMDPRVYGSIKDDKAAVKGKTAARVMRKLETAQLRIGQPAALVRGVGRCSAVMVNEAPFFALARETIKVHCESPAELPFRIGARLLRSDGSRVWDRYLGDSMPYISYPTEDWLSPINRRQTFFHTSDGIRMDPGSRWLVPREYLPGAVVEIEAVRPAGCVVVDYELRDLALPEYRVK